MQPPSLDYAGFRKNVTINTGRLRDEAVTNDVKTTQRHLFMERIS